MSGANIFLSQRAMASFRWEESVRNSRIKRGEYKRSNHTDICKCGCGDETCHFEYDLTKYYNKDRQ